MILIIELYHILLYITTRFHYQHVVMAEINMECYQNNVGQMDEKVYQDCFNHADNHIYLFFLSAKY